ncbi:MAG: hypothetical protein ACO1OB_30665 [Archangium sp.]
MWWVALVVAAVPAEQWADEAPAKEQPAVVEGPFVGPVGGVHLGASLGNAGPEFGVRLGARVRIAPHLALSVFVDGQWTTNVIYGRCDLGRLCESEPFISTLASVITRLEFINEGSLGPLLVPRLSAGVFVGGALGIAPPVEVAGVTIPGGIAPGLRLGLHFGFTRLPNDWWVPFFLDLGTLCSTGGCNELNFVAGIGL